MTQTITPGTESGATTAPLIVFSSDSHIGPRTEDLRPYCPKEHLEAFDAFMADAVEQTKASGTPDKEERAGVYRRWALNLQTDGHHDMHARLRDMDDDGIAAQVIFHFSQNLAPFPMNMNAFHGAGAINDYELTAVGVHIYNQWLADVCTIQPERHIGLAHLPVWDIDASIREVEWAREAGLRGVNFPAPRSSMLEFDDPAWEPFWAACADLGMPLNTHCGAAVPGNPRGRPHGKAVVTVEAGGWPSRRGIGRMIFAGVFERYANLKLVITEIPGAWWPYDVTELDSVWLHDAGTSLSEQVPRKPSDYFRTNISIGASFMSHFEAEAAVEHGFVDNIIWGSDYPHREGTWAYRERDDEPKRTHLALRDAFAGIPADAVRKMVGLNAVDVFDLDAPALADIAVRIGAPTVEDITIPLDDDERAEVQRILDPEIDYSHAFRTVGAWY